METRFLGRSGLEVSVFSFGVMTFGGKGMFANVGAVQLDEGRRMIDMCREAGVNLFDTANGYSSGQAEEILGEIVAPYRQQVIIATKCYARVGKQINDAGLSRKHIVEACEDSLRRMKTDYIDLYQAHCFDSMTPLEETLRAFDDLVRAGKVRYIGCSNYFGWQLTKALSVSERKNVERYISQQIQYSLSVRDVETEMLPAGIDQGVGALIWGPLAAGFLSGKFRNEVKEPTRIASGATNRLVRYDTPQGQATLAAMDEIAAAHDATLSQVALNWVRARPGVTSVIIGARTPEQLEDNLGAATWELTTEEVDRLDEVSRPQGRYPGVQHAFFNPERNPYPFKLS
jgi:aryl-alcohol dehydrogenase-like predicted oxidoreductase